MRSTAISVSVCLSVCPVVCLFDRISRNPHVQIFCTCYLWSWLGNAIRYVLPAGMLVLGLGLAERLDKN